jgi:hypothetical protein
MVTLTPAAKPDLELLFEVNATLQAPVIVGPTPQGLRRMVPILEGTFEGPHMRGTVLPGGADWQFVRADGVTEVEALYLLRTDDEVTFQVHNRGLRHGPEEVMQRLFAGEPVDPREYYFRATPIFSAPDGKYAWLNRNVYLCTGARYASSIRLWMYRVT